MALVRPNIMMHGYLLRSEDVTTLFVGKPPDRGRNKVHASGVAQDWWREWLISLPLGPVDTGQR